MIAPRRFVPLQFGNKRSQKFWRNLCQNYVSRGWPPVRQFSQLLCEN
jgi:hypothetical protein